MSLVAKPPVTREELEQLLARRILVLDGAMGTMVHALKFDEAEFRGSSVRQPSERPAESDRYSLHHPARRHRENPSRVSRSRRRHHRNQHLRRHQRGPGRFRPGRPRARNQSGRRGAGPPRRRRIHRPQSGKAPLRRRLDRSHQQAAFDRRQCRRSRLSHRHVRPDGRHLLRTGRSAGRRRRRHSAGRNRLRHARAQGLPVRHRKIFRRSQRPPARDGFVHRLQRRSHALRPNDRGRVGIRSPMPICSASASTAPWVPNRLRPYIEELSSVAPIYVSCYPNAGLPNAFGGFDETPAIDGPHARRICPQWLAEHRRRLLRHHARPHQSHRRGREQSRRHASVRTSSPSRASAVWNR